MLDHDTRSAVLRLRCEGHGTRTIARALGISRNSVRAVLKSGDAEVPIIERASKAEPYVDRIRELWASCKGNLVRVHEELYAEGIDLAYSTLTAFCRKAGIGTPPKRRVGRYEFDPGEEMQHDTSPHGVTIADEELGVQCASLVMAFSRVVFAQVYPRWSRFECKAFLTEAFKYIGGTASRCMLDNSSIVILQETTGTVLVRGSAV